MMSKRPNHDAVRGGGGGTGNNNRNTFGPSAAKRPRPLATLSVNGVDCLPDREQTRMRVFVRVRPPSDMELSESNPTGGRRVMEVLDTRSLIFDPRTAPDEDDGSHYFYRGRTYHTIGTKPPKNINFTFDRVFDERSSNMDVYESVTKRLVGALLDGFNCSVFAYGATGSGKTFTMLGTEDSPGVIFLTMMELFRRIEARNGGPMSNGNESGAASGHDGSNSSISGEDSLELSVSYFEIYNEQVRDLLDPTPPTGKGGLAVREDRKGGVCVANLSVHRPRDAYHVINMLEYGNRNRTQHPTDMNSESSRSHAVFQISVKKHSVTVDSQQDVCIQLSKMSLIDLAGSERASAAYKTINGRHSQSKSLQREGGNINKSLLALGNCINALAKLAERPGGFRLGAAGSGMHIPYRNSRLTLLLRDSLQGNCQTAMIAAVSPCALAYEDTHNTLVYAKRASGIKLNINRNSFAVDPNTVNYAAICEQLRTRNNELTEQIKKHEAIIQNMRRDWQATPRDPIQINGTAVDKLNRLKNSLDGIFARRLALRRKLLEVESKSRKVDLKLLWRRLNRDRANQLARIRDQQNADDVKETIQTIDKPEGGDEDPELEKPKSVFNSAAGGPTVTLNLGGSAKPVRGGNKPDQFQALYNKKLYFSDERSQVVEELRENQQQLDELVAQLVDEETGKLDYVAEAYLDRQHTNILQQEIVRRTKHSNEVISEMIADRVDIEKIVVTSFDLVNYMHDILAARCGVSQELDSRCHEFTRQVENKKSVVWRDQRNSGDSGPVKVPNTRSSCAQPPPVTTDSPLAAPPTKLIRKHELEEIIKLPVYKRVDYYEDCDHEAPSPLDGTYAVGPGGIRGGASGRPSSAFGFTTPAPKRGLVSIYGGNTPSPSEVARLKELADITAQLPVGDENSTISLPPLTGMTPAHVVPVHPAVTTLMTACPSSSDRRGSFTLTESLLPAGLQHPTKIETLD